MAILGCMDCSDKQKDQLVKWKFIHSKNMSKLWQIRILNKEENNSTLYLAIHLSFPGLSSLFRRSVISLKNSLYHILFLQIYWQYMILVSVSENVFNVWIFGEYRVLDYQRFFFFFFFLSALPRCLFFSVSVKKTECLYHWSPVITCSRQL